MGSSEPLSSPASSSVRWDNDLQLTGSSRGFERLRNEHTAGTTASRECEPLPLLSPHDAAAAAGPPTLVHDGTPGTVVRLGGVKSPAKL